MGLFDSLYQPNWFTQPNLAQALNFTPGMMPQVPQMPAAASVAPLGSSLAPVPGMPSSGSVLPNLNIGRGAVPVPAAASVSPAVTPDPNQPNPFWGNAQAITQGVGMLGNLGLGIWGMVNATDAYNFQKDLAKKNYDNSVKSYNTAVEDRVRSRYTSVENAGNQSQINSEIEKRKL